MAKQGMKRPEPQRKKNEYPPVPEIKGAAKHGHIKAAPLIPGANGKVFHGDNDLAGDNQMNDWDMTAADAQDFGREP